MIEVRGKQVPLHLFSKTNRKEWQKEVTYIVHRMMIA